MGVPAKRRLITFSYHLVVVMLVVTLSAIGEKFQNQTMIYAAMLLLLADILTFRLIPLSRYLAQWIIRSAICYGCGNRVNLYGFWTDCKFRSYRPRHIMSPCPSCGKVPDWIQCPACETSIPV